MQVAGNRRTLPSELNSSRLICSSSVEKEESKIPSSVTQKHFFIKNMYSLQKIFMTKNDVFWVIPACQFRYDIGLEYFWEAVPSVTYIKIILKLSV